MAYSPKFTEISNKFSGMRFFRKDRKIDGWMAVSFYKDDEQDGVLVAHVRRETSSIPSLEMAAFYPLEKSSSAATLEKLAKELNAGLYRCTTILGAGEYHLLSVDAPNVPAHELRTAIRWRLKDMLDFHIDDATVDVIDVPVDKNAAARSHSMYAVAARNRIIEQRQALFADARIPLEVIDIPEMAQRNFSAMLEPEGRGLALLSIDTDGGLLTVAYAGELFLSRRIDVTLSQLARADSGQRSAFYERIALELQRSLDHFDRQYHFITIAKLALAPMGEPLSGLKDYLAANLYIPVEALDLETVLDISKVPELKSPQAQQRFFMTLGAALRHEEKAL
jgi:MSHA biogenesis protein MshI